MTIGILLPRSTYYNSIGIDIYQGIQSSLKNQGINDVRLVTENIGFGADKQQCYRGAERLLLEENAQLVIAYLGHRMAQILRPLFQAMNRVLIVLDAGANLPQENPKSNNIFYHSFNNSLGAWLMSKNACSDGLIQGGVVTGYYDGGYLHTYALAEGYGKAGGAICFNFATGYKEEAFSMEGLKKFTAEFPNSALLTLFSGDFVQWYFAELVKHFGINDLPVYLAPFGLEERMLDEAVYPGNNKKGISAWSRDLDNSENKIFMETLLEDIEQPGLFHLMGWEAGLIIGYLLGQNATKAKDISAAMEQIQLIGPRGMIQMYSEYNTTYAPMYEASIQESSDGKCQLISGNKLDVLEDLKAMSELKLGEVQSAWYNSYTCI